MRNVNRHLRIAAGMALIGLGLFPASLETNDSSNAQSSRPPGRLKAWRFDESTEPMAFKKDARQKQSLASDASLKPVYGPETGNKSIQAMQAGEGLRLPLSPEVIFQAFPEGAVRFWFKPDWDSGAGPGGYATLFSLGEWTSPPPTIGYFGLNVSPDGRRLMLGAQVQDKGTTLLQVDPQFKKGQWHEIVLCYGKTKSYVYIDGRRLGPGRGLEYYPSPEVMERYGLIVGNNHGGYQPARGWIDGLEIYNYPLEDVEIAFDDLALSAKVESDPPAVELTWRRNPNKPVTIQRRKAGETDWRILETDCRSLHYRDESPELESGGLYEYNLRFQSIQVALFTPPEPSPGAVLILIDETIERAVRKRLSQYEEDLRGAGWTVQRQTAPRHDDRDWEANVPRIARVNEAIRAFARETSADLKTVTLVGHVAVPYSGFRAEDGHSRPGDDHRGAWPCDGYYGDLDGNWRDEKGPLLNQSFPANTNRPNDGKWDEDYFPSPLEVAIGRIDFANLPDLRAKETELLNRYFDKNHAYRRGDLKFPEQAWIRSRVSPGLSHNILRNGIGNATAWYGSVPGNVRTGDGFENTGKAAWSFMAGYSSPATFASRYRVTQDMNSPSSGPLAAFLMIYSSFHADWNMKNNFLRAMLTSPSAGIAAMSSVAGQWKLAEMGFGKTLAEGFLNSANPKKPYFAVGRSLAVMGDPTLTMFLTLPAQDFKTQPCEDGSIQLAWKTSPGAAPDGFVLYQGQSKDGPYEPIQTLSGSDRAYSLPSAEDGGHFMLRVMEWKHTGSGVFANLSQGVFLHNSLP